MQKGQKHTSERKSQISKQMLGNKHAVGSKWNKKKHESMSLLLKGNKHTLGRKQPKEEIVRRTSSLPRRENHHSWIEDRGALKKSEYKHLDVAYLEWMKAVKNRDDWKCKINNEECRGRLEAHHILRWSKFPELRYEVNNGISLCALHHPRKINDEETLAPLFRELIVTEK